MDIIHHLKRVEGLPGVLITVRAVLAVEPRGIVNALAVGSQRDLLATHGGPPLVAGKRWEQTCPREMSRDRYPQNLTSVCQVEALETITVPAGSLSRLVSEKLQPERPGVLGEYVSGNKGVGCHVRHDGVSELPALTERQRIAYTGEAPCQPTAVQQAKQDGRQEARKPRELSWTDGFKISCDKFMDHIAAKGQFFG